MMLSHVSLGPVLSPMLEGAASTAPLRRSRWQHGVVAAANAFERPYSGFGAVQVFIGSGIGVVAGVVLGGLAIIAQFLVGGAAGVAAYWAVPTSWAGIAALGAAKPQREQARRYAQALEAHLRRYERWATRRYSAIDWHLNGALAYETARHAGGRLDEGTIEDWRIQSPNYLKKWVEYGGDATFANGLKVELQPLIENAKTLEDTFRPFSRLTDALVVATNEGEHGGPPRFVEPDAGDVQVDEPDGEER